jgi:hypothetical protein
MKEDLCSAYAFKPEKTVVITTPGEIAAFSSLPPLDLLK